MRRKERALIEALKRQSPAAINALNQARGAHFAIIYSTEFSEISAELIRLYRHAGEGDPVAVFSRKCLENNILTCRGADMSYARAQYFFRRYLSAMLRRLPKFQFPHSFGKDKCPHCGRYFSNVRHHLEWATQNRSVE